MRVFFVFLLLTNTMLFSQQKQIYSSELTLPDVRLITTNLDDVVVENSVSNKLEIVLENDNQLPLKIKTIQKDDELIVSFEKVDEADFTPQIFRKYITKRLERARIRVKIPIKKSVNIVGETVGVESISYNGKLSVYINKGNVRLHNIVGTTFVNLFLGNIYATIANTNLELKTTNGKVKINNKKKPSFYVKNDVSNISSLSVNSINANIYLTEK